jgi:hypothetical protein
MASQQPNSAIIAARIAASKARTAGSTGDTLSANEGRPRNLDNQFSNVQDQTEITSETRVTSLPPPPYEEFETQRNMQRRYIPNSSSYGGFASSGSRHGEGSNERPRDGSHDLRQTSFTEYVLVIFYVSMPNVWDLVKEPRGKTVVLFFSWVHLERESPVS